MVDRVPYLVVVMELDRVPLAITDPAGDVGRHRGLRLTWVTREGGEERGREQSDRGWTHRSKSGKVWRGIKVD